MIQGVRLLEHVLIKMKMFDGIFRTLDVVRHISNLKKNLVLLSRLGILNYCFSIKN